MKSVLAAFLVAVALPMCAQTARGQSAQSNDMGGSPGSFSISGVVASAVTGTPLARVTVTLSTPGANGTEIGEILTGEGGAFRFDGLTTGKYALEASRRGYLDSGYQDHGGYFTAIVTGPNLQSEGLRFELTPYGSIEGTVSDDNGNPVSGARVGLFREDRASGEGTIASAGQDTTDDGGAYEFANLRPGTYYVDVSATPWYASHPGPSLDDSGNAVPDNQPPPSPLDVAYPLSFYPNATDSASASPIPVTAGDRVQINFSLHAVPAVHLQVRVPISVNLRRGAPAPQLSQEVFGTQEPADMPDMAVSRHDNLMVFTYDVVASGHYMIQQGTQPPVPIDASSSRIVAAPSAAAPSAEVAGKFAMASGAPMPDGVFISLRPLVGQQTRMSSSVGRDGAFRLQSVAAGTYEVVVIGASGTLVVAQMAASGGEVRGNRITVGADPVLLAATLARGSVTINGFAKRNGKGVGGTMIVLVPVDPNASTELVRRDQSDSDGSFTLTDVIPGNYVLVSIDNGWSLEWAKREVIAPYLVSGLKVQVPESQKTLNLSDAVTVQDR
jgi:hypothetical protein